MCLQAEIIRLFRTPKFLKNALPHHLDREGHTPSPPSTRSTGANALVDDSDADIMSDDMSPCHLEGLSCAVVSHRSRVFVRPGRAQALPSRVVCRMHCRLAVSESPPSAHALRHHPGTLERAPPNGFPRAYTYAREATAHG